MRTRLVAAAALVLGLAAAPVAGPAPSPEAVASAAGSCPAASTAALRVAPGRGRTVALTFDDGPGPFTPQVLEILRRENVRATFFELGDQAAIWPEYARQVAAEGHQLGNHSQTHPDLRRLSAQSQARQLDTAQSVLRSVTGVRPCVFRPPFGSSTAATRSLAARRGMRTWLWSHDSEDWRTGGTRTASGTASIVRRSTSVSGNAHPVVLMHDGGHHRPNLVAALPSVIRYYKQHGYRFVGLDGGSTLSPRPTQVVDWRRSPVGSEGVVAGSRSLTASGWALDPDAPRTSLMVTVLVDGRRAATVVAQGPRADVAARYPAAGVAHGFSVRVPAAPGKRTVCLLAGNVGPGATGGLGCAAVTVR